MADHSLARVFKEELDVCWCHPVALPLRRGLYLEVGGRMDVQGSGLGQVGRV